MINNWKKEKKNFWCQRNDVMKQKAKVSTTIIYRIKIGGVKVEIKSHNTICQCDRRTSMTRIAF